jgi:hypothetical protein
MKYVEIKHMGKRLYFMGWHLRSQTLLISHENEMGGKALEQNQSPTSQLHLISNSHHSLTFIELF